MTAEMGASAAAKVTRFRVDGESRSLKPEARMLNPPSGRRRHLPFSHCGPTVPQPLLSPHPVLLGQCLVTLTGLTFSTLPGGAPDL